MNRFIHTKKKADNRIWISVLIFVLIIGLFYVGIQSFSTKTDAQQKESLENTIRQSAIQCYSIEGYYPESLTYLEEHYAISFDKEKYFVDYQPIGANLMPDITIIQKSTHLK